MAMILRLNIKQAYNGCHILLCISLTICVNNVTFDSVDLCNALYTALGIRFIPCGSISLFFAALEGMGEKCKLND